MASLILQINATIKIYRNICRSPHTSMTISRTFLVILKWARWGLWTVAIKLWICSTVSFCSVKEALLEIEICKIRHPSIKCKNIRLILQLRKSSSVTWNRTLVAWNSDSMSRTLSLARPFSICRVYNPMLRKVGQGGLRDRQLDGLTSMSSNSPLLKRLGKTIKDKWWKYEPMKAITTTERTIPGLATWWIKRTGVAWIV